MVKPMPAFFLVRIPRDLQVERQTKKGNMYLHPNYVYMTRGMQWGEIVDIGKLAHKQLPEAEPGQILLFHHFVESNEKQNGVYQDNKFNYYVVTAMYHNGQNNQTYGVYDGQRIIANYEYLFLDCEQPASSSLPMDQYLDQQLQKHPSGLFLFKDWRIDRDELRLRMEKLRGEIESLSKSKQSGSTARNMWMMNTPGAIAKQVREMAVDKAIREKEAEMDEISRVLNERKYELFSLVSANSHFLEQAGEVFGDPIAPGDLVYMLNIACETKIEFNGTEYIVAKSMHFAFPQAWVKKGLSKGLVLLGS